MELNSSAGVGRGGPTPAKGPHSPALPAPHPKSQRALSDPLIRFSTQRKHALKWSSWGLCVFCSESGDKPTARPAGRRPSGAQPGSLFLGALELCIPAEHPSTCLRNGGTVVGCTLWTTEPIVLKGWVGR